MTANLNGIRSATTKGFFTWFLTQDVDILCAQEVRAQEEQIPLEVRTLPGYHSYFLAAQKKGYSGVALYSRVRPDLVQSGFGDAQLDAEGRYIRADFGDLSISSLYAPSGTSGDHRQAMKDHFMEHFGAHCANLRNDGRRHIICGDVNIAHRPIDLKNWKANQLNSGFLPHERAWLDHLFDDLGMVDAFRAVDDRPEQYTWWSARGAAREKNIGWRIDYHIVSPNLKNCIRQAAIHATPFFSDHAPLVVEYDVTLK